MYKESWNIPRLGPRTSVAMVSCLAAVLGTSGVQAQDAGDLIRVSPARPLPPGLNADTAPMLIDTSAPVVNLLQRAEEGIAREDWKLAIDSLQRVIDDPEGALVSRPAPTTNQSPTATLRLPQGIYGGIGAGDMNLYESARLAANRMLASLPPEGLQAYRVLYDGAAKRLFERARERHDAAALRHVASRYLLTQYGDDASDLLASWALDEGQPGLALALLTDVLEIVADYDVPKRLLFGKLAAAYALLGQTDQSNAVIAAYEQTGEPNLGEGLLVVADGLKRLGGTSFPHPAHPETWGSSERSAEGIGARLGRNAATAPYRPAPPLDPSLGPATPWVYELPGSSADLWRRIHDDDPAAALVLPSGQSVSDGTRLFVRQADGFGGERGRTGCVALDIQDLTLLWESSGRLKSRSVRNARRAPTPRNTAPAPTPNERVEDYIGGAISYAHGLVIVVEREGIGEGSAASNVRVVFPPNRTTDVTPLATRLVAFNAASGELRWQRGADGEGDDELSDVQFRSAPISVGDQLWVPYFKQSDLFVAVLNPSDGSLIRSVLLGSAREPINPLAPTLLPAVSDGIVFVPTGYGALFALDAADATVRWACQYDRGGRPRRDPRTAPVTAWLPGPPVVAGGRVLLAATDHRELVALAVGSGEVRWSVAVEPGSYVIAADSTRVWLGGRTLSCLSVVDGKSLWTTRLIAVPTGRGAVAGEVVFVPTSEGLLSLNAATGAAIGVQATPSSQPPLGDLLCLGTALFSIDPTSVRKFPDLERNYSKALALTKSLPTDPSAAMQLAWAELLRGEPARADEALRRISSAHPALSAAPGLRLESYARLRVETSLALAAKAPSGSPEALHWLEAANEAAHSAADRLRCRLAIADQHIAGGRDEEAYSNLLQLWLSNDADQMVRTVESVETTARTQIAQRVNELHMRLNPTQTARLDDEIGRQLSEVKQLLQEGREVRRARAQLQALAEFPVMGPVGKGARLELSNWERRQLRFERAEQILLEGARRPSDPGAVEALLGLCELYGPSVQDQVFALMPCLDELGARLGSEPVSGEVAGWMAEVREGIPSAVREAYLATTGPKTPGRDPVPELVGDVAWTYYAPEGSYLGRLLRVDPEEQVGPERLTTEGSPFLRDRILLYRSDGGLDCLSAGRGDLLWQTRLQLPEEFEEGAAGNTPPLESGRRAVADGQTAVLNGTDGLFAVGLVTGRRLWMRQHDTVRNDSDTYKQDWAMAAADGLLAATPRQGRLTLMRMIDGSTVWERDLRGEPVDAIWMNTDRVMTADPARERVHLFERASGRLINQVLFQQPDASPPVVRLVRTGGRIVGPDAVDASRGVVAVDESRGERVWQVELELPVAQLFVPQDGYVGISLGQGMVRIVKAASGETVLERRVSGAYSVSGGVLLDGLLVLRVETVRGQKQSVQLAAFDVATGEEVWRREDIGSFPPPDPGNSGLRIENGAIPAMVESTHTEISSAGAATPRTRTILVLIDSRTGRNLGPGADLTPTGAASRFSGDVVQLGDAVVVGTQRTVTAYRPKPGPPAGGEPPRVEPLRVEPRDRPGKH